jgi:hypothetical protein
MPSSKRIPRNKWIWHGMAGHFISWRRCHFVLHTTIGPWRISTIGCYHDEPYDEQRAPLRGNNQFYETMIFKNDKSQGTPTSWIALDSTGYTTEEEAEAGHMALCLAWAYEGGRDGSRCT